MYCIPKEIFMPQEFLDTLVCNAGKGMLNDAVSLPCQHVFCRKCIELALATNQQCPVCSAKATTSSLIPQPTFNELIGMSLVKCPKCEWSGDYHSYSLHEKKCSPNTVVCPQGCGLPVVKRCINQHMLECRFRKVFCKECNEAMTYGEQLFHDELCSKKVVLCPNGCGEKFPVFKKSAHADVCTGPKPTCPFAFAGCSFRDNFNAKGSEGHQNQGFIDHLTMLGSILSKLMYKADMVEHVPVLPRGHAPIGARPLDVLWSNGEKTIRGKKVGWSFFLSEKPVTGNFMIRVKVCNVGADLNGWKICLGLFTSNLYTVGSWGNYGNGYGYILANGCKMHIKGPEKYGEAYSMGDVVTVEYKNKDVIFYKNGQSQGVAYSDVGNPCYLAVALAHKDHQLTILDAAYL